MTTPSHTTINIASRVPTAPPTVPRYEHFFRVQYDRDPEDSGCALVIKTLREKFPAPAFKLDVVYWERKGRTIAVP